MEKLNKAVDKAYEVYKKACKVQSERQMELCTELDACYTNIGGIVRFEHKSKYDYSIMNGIRNRVIISQINSDSNIDQIIKDIVEDFTS